MCVVHGNVKIVESKQCVLFRQVCGILKFVFIV
jgi:hypothetical protein